MWIMLAVLNPLWPMRRWNIITCNAPAIRDLSRDQPPNLLNENSAHHIENGKSHDTPAQIVDRCTWWWEYCFSAFQSKWPMSNFRKFWISDSSCIQGSIVPSPSQIAVFWWISDAFRPVKEEKQGKPFADVLHQNPTCRSPIGKHHFKPQRKRPQTSMCCELKQWFIFVAFHQWQQWSLKKHIYSCDKQNDPNYSIHSQMVHSVWQLLLQAKIQCFLCFIHLPPQKKHAANKN